MRLTFKSVKHMQMLLPIGAITPVDISDYEFVEFYVLENRATYKIDAVNTGE